jgi:hypothetical protein
MEMLLKKKIRNCHVRMEVICPKVWDELKETGTETIRFCMQCEKQVYYCDNAEDTLKHAQAGHCIARACPDDHSQQPMMLGMPAPQQPLGPTEDDIAEFELLRRENAISEVLLNIASFSAIRCPVCEYPLTKLRPSCRVCGYRIEENK